MDIESRKIENREAEPKHNIVVVDFLRHGSTEYLENFTSEEKKRLQNWLSSRSRIRSNAECQKYRKSTYNC